MQSTQNDNERQETPRIVNYSQAAVYVGTSPRVIAHLVNIGELKLVDGLFKKIAIDELERWIAEQVAA